MRVLIGAMIVACTASFAAAQFVDYTPAQKPKPGDKVGLTREQFDAIKAGLEKNAASAVEGVSKDREAAFALNGLTYDKATWNMVRQYLDSIDKLKLPGVKKVELHHKLYIICRLLQPLIAAKPDVIREALPTVRKIEDEYHNAYVAFPKWSQNVLNSCKMPAKVPGGPTRLDLLDKVDKARQQKTAAEQPTIIVAEAIASIEQVYACMMAFAQDSNEDLKLMQWIQTNEKNKNHVWKLGLEAINTEAASGAMSKDRAKAVNQLMHQLVADKIREAKGNAADFEYSYCWYKAAYLPEPLVDDNSKTLTWRWEYTGYTLLTSTKWLEMAINGITDPTGSSMVVKNPYKSNRETFGTDKEYWDINKTKIEKTPPGYDGPPPR